jgi:hypothetical protein
MIVTSPLFLAAILLIGSGGASQGQPVSNGRQEATPGLFVTASLTGRVTTSAQPVQGIPKAMLVLSGSQLPTPRMVVADIDGRFIFSGLREGEYRLIGTRAGYVSMAFGAQKPNRPGAVISVKAGVPVRDIDIALGQASAISGRVMGPFGEPMAGASVTALRSEIRFGEEWFVDTFQTTVTDELGEYRLSGLASGKFLVAATPGEFGRNRRDFVRLTERDVDLALAGIAPPPASAPSSVPPPPTLGFPLTFFGDTPSAETATPITLGFAEERLGVDVTLALRPMARIEGMVTDDRGQPVPTARVSLIPLGPKLQATGWDFAPGGKLARRESDANGRFAFTGVPAGPFELRATSGEQHARTELVWASQPVQVDGADQNVVMTLRPGLSLSGTLTAVGMAADAATFGHVNITLESLAQDSFGDRPDRFAARIAGDGAFEITGLPEGRYRMTVEISAAGMWAGAAAISAKAGSIDLLEAPFIVAPGSEYRDVVIELSRDSTELSGSLESADGERTHDYFVVVFPQAPTSWAPMSRRLVAARPNTDGTFRFRNLPPGDYFVAAVADLTDGEWYDRALLQDLAAANPIPVRLLAGEHKVVNLRIR